MSSDSRVLGFYCGRRLSEVSHFHICEFALEEKEFHDTQTDTDLVHEYFELMHGYLDICYALASYLALANANKEKIVAVLHLLYRPCVSSHSSTL